MCSEHQTADYAEAQWSKEFHPNDKACTSLGVFQTSTSYDKDLYIHCHKIITQEIYV